VELRPSSVPGSAPSHELAQPGILRGRSIQSLDEAPERRLAELEEAAIQEDNVSKEAWQRMSQAMFKIELQNEQNAGVDREVEKAAYWANTGWLVARLLLRLFLRV
jgi:hypothetical protein